MIIGVKTVNETYDLLRAHMPLASNDPKLALDALRVKLTALNYPLLNNLDELVKSHDATIERGKKTRADVHTAGAEAHALVKDILNLDLRAGTAPVEPPVPVAAAPAPATPVAATANTPSAENAMTDTTAINPIDNARNIAGLLKEITPAAVESIDVTLKSATNSRQTNISQLIEALDKAANAANAQRDALEDGAKKLAALQAGQENAADMAFVAPPVFTASGYADVVVEGSQKTVLNTLLSMKNEGKITDEIIYGALRAVEAIALAQNADLRTLAADIRKATPKTKIAFAQDGDGPKFTVVMRLASEVFKNNFGESSPILNFEIPTLEWDTPHPDVPEIDHTFRFFSPVLATCVDAFATGTNVWLQGESGCGKSEMWTQIAARTGFPLFRLNMDSHLTRSDLIGTNRLVPGPNGQPTMIFVEGIIPRALKVPSLLLIDEIDLADPQIMPVLQPVLEGKGITLLEDSARYVKPHEFSRIGITANTIGLGSANQMYGNAHEQSAATRDRIGRYVKMQYLPEDKEVEVVLLRHPDIDATFVRNVVKIANKVRDGYALGELHQVFSTRVVLAAVAHYARFIDLYPDEKMVVNAAIEVTMLNRCDDATRAKVVGFVDNILA